MLEENRDLANEVVSAFEAATAAINEYQKAALGGDNPSGEGNRDDGSGKGSPSGSAEGGRDTGSPYNPEASARNLENGEYRSAGYKGEIQGLLSGSLTSSPDSSARDYSLRSAELYLAHALAPDEEYDRNTGSRVNPDSFYGDHKGAYYDTHDGLDSEISRYLYNRIGPRADSDFARELNTAIRNLADAEANGDDTAEYLEQVKSLMPDLIQGVKDIVDKYDEPPEPSTSESGEGNGLEGSLNLEGARGELEAFREEAAEPVALSGNAAGIVSAAKSALSSVKSMFSTPLTIKAKIETEGGGDGDGVDTGGSALKMSTGGRFTKPTDVQVAEDGDAEYIIPVKKENRAVPLLKQLMGELSPEARQSLAGDDETAGAVPDENLQALVPEREPETQTPEPLCQTAAQPLPQVREAEKQPPEAQTALQKREPESDQQTPTVTQVIQLSEITAPQPLPQVREILTAPQPAPAQASEPEEKQEKSPALAPEPEPAPLSSVIQNFYEAAEPAAQPLPAVRESAEETAVQPLPVIRELIDTPAATQPLAAAAGKEPAPDAGASGLLSKLGDLLSTSLHETVAPVVQNTSQNVSAPVTIQVRSTGANAEQVGQKLYDTAERYLLRTLKSVMA